MQLLAGIGPLGLPELAIIAFIVVLVFGVGRLPEVGGAVGKGIREFRKASKDDDAASDASTTGPRVVERLGRTNRRRRLRLRLGLLQRVRWQESARSEVLRALRTWHYGHRQLSSTGQHN